MDLGIALVRPYMLYLRQHVQPGQRQQQHGAIGGRVNEAHQRVDEVVGLDECVRAARLEQKRHPGLRAETRDGK